MELLECSLRALLACFSWSNLYIDSGVSIQDSQVPYEYWRNVSPSAQAGVQETILVWDVAHRTDNPYGRLALGYEIEFKRFAWRIEAAHVSSIPSGTDRGINSLTLSARWHPFRE